jgi:hypothetical protein
MDKAARAIIFVSLKMKLTSGDPPDVNVEQLEENHADCREMRSQCRITKEPKAVDRSYGGWQR